MHRAWVGLGSNLGDPAQQLGAALDAMSGTPGIAVLARSSLYRTKAWGDQRQPDFLNAVVALHVAIDANQLLDALLEIELMLGRTRDTRRWGPRTIDLDLLLFDDCVLDSERLVLPHPRMHERAFVLVPLLELCGDIDIPGHGAASACLERIGTEEVERLDLSW